jgi:hypothetical protein
MHVEQGAKAIDENLCDFVIPVAKMKVAKFSCRISEAKKTPSLECPP